MSDLKRCPFCGAIPDKPTAGSIACDTIPCPIYGRSMRIEQWNTRPIEDKYRRALEDVERWAVPGDLDTLSLFREALFELRLIAQEALND